MSSSDIRGEFTDVDRAADPSHFVRLLDSITALDFVQQYKQRTYQILDPKPGEVILEVGCGNGDDVREIARRVQPNGRVIGVDRSATLIEQARGRSIGSGLPIEFRVGDVHQLDLEDNAFDACRADRVLHHLDNPNVALREMLRVARPGATLVMAEPDFETAIIDAPDRALTRRLLNLNCDSYRNGWIGRQLPAFMRDAGLIDIRIEPITVLLTDYAVADRVLALEGTVKRATEIGLVSPADGAEWLGYLQEASRKGRLFGAMTAFIFSGRKSVS